VVGRTVTRDDARPAASAPDGGPSDLAGERPGAGKPGIAEERLGDGKPAIAGERPDAVDPGAAGERGTPALRIPPAARAAMARHAAEAYPEECCGALIGTDGLPRSVDRVVAAGNARSEERGRRYLIEPGTVRAAERAAGDDGLEVIGFYHSHPDHPARPSGFDRDHAWPWYSYVIVPATSSGAGAPRAWRLRDDRSGFDEQEITS